MKKIFVLALVSVCLFRADAQSPSNYQKLMAKLQKLATPISIVNIFGRDVAIYEYAGDIRISQSLQLVAGDNFKKYPLTPRQAVEFLEGYSSLLQLGGSTIILSKDGRGEYWLTDVRSSDDGRVLKTDRMPYIWGYQPSGAKYRLVILAPITN